MSDPASKELLIVYHSQSGRNRQLAEAAFDGALAEGIDVRILRVQEAGSADLLACGALMIVMPENFGQLPGAIKDFFDRSFYRLEHRQLALPYALLVCCGNDGSNAIRQLQRIVTGYPFKQVAEPLISHGEPDEAALSAARDAGQALGAGLSMGIF